MSNNFSTNFNKNINRNSALNNAEIDVTYIITDCRLPGQLQTRFAELGFVKGAKVTVIKKAPLGDPLEVNIMGYSLCVRANEAKYISITRANDE